MKFTKSANGKIRNVCGLKEKERKFWIQVVFVNLILKKSLKYPGWGLLVHKIALPMVPTLPMYHFFHARPIFKLPPSD